MSENGTAEPVNVGMDTGQYLQHISRERHPSTREIARWFTFSHLAEGLPRYASSACARTAADMLEELPDSPELTAGLRKLLEAKDCFVRAAIAAASPGITGAGTEHLAAQLAERKAGA